MSRGLFFKRLEDVSSRDSCSIVTVKEVMDAISKQKIGKAVGMDGTALEALIHGGHKLAIHVCFLFNLCIKHGPGNLWTQRSYHLLNLRVMIYRM